MEETIEGISAVKRKYERRGFEIQCWYTDNKLNNDRAIEVIEPEKIECYAREEHVGVI